MPIEQLVEEQWICSECRSSPVSVALHEACVNCGHHRCLACVILKYVRKPDGSLGDQLPPISTPSGYESKSDEEIEDYSEDDSQWDADFDEATSSELPPDIDPDERLINPSKYFAELEEMANEVHLRSAFRILGRTQTRFDPSRPLNPFIVFACPEGDDLPKLLGINDSEVLEGCRRLLASTDSGETPTAYLRTFLELAECRNIIHAVSHNLHRLSHAKFCNHVFSLMALDNDRDVAKLVPLKVFEVVKLHDLFNKTLDSCYEYICTLTNSLSSNTRETRAFLGAVSEDQYLYMEKDLAHHCRSFLKEKLNIDPAVNVANGEIWRALVHLLDLAVISYAGAHVGDYPYDSSEPVILDCHIRFTRIHHLRCLDTLLGGQPIWTFETQSATLDGLGLYLSTDVETFADIWGPLWEVKSQLEPGKISHYNIGSGIISRCPDPSDPMAPELRAREVYAHWEPKAQWISAGSQLPPGDYMTTQLYFKEDDVLLIGAGRHALRSNPDCRRDLTQILQNLRDFRRLRPVGTSKSSRVQDTDTFQAQIGGGGVQVGYQRSYKLRTVQTWKQALVESWTNSPERRNPWILQQRCGAEVSACTWNARRIRLIEIMKTQTMRNFMKFYTWRIRDCQSSFNTALDSEDLSSLPRLILDEKDCETRREYGDALSTCFRVLSITGLSDNAELSLLWCPEPESEYLATLLRSEHTWTGFLKDSVNSCTYAVLDNRCLVSTYSDGQTCRRFGETPGYSLFETNLVVNERIRPEGVRKRHNHKTWDVSRISAGYSFSLGDQGKLVVMAALSRSTLLTYWRPHRFERLHDLKEKINEVILGKDAGIYHREYSHAEPVDIRPIHVLVVSEQREPL